jgi:hypothetical protein
MSSFDHNNNQTARKRVEFGDAARSFGWHVYNILYKYVHASVTESHYSEPNGQRMSFQRTMSGTGLPLLCSSYSTYSLVCPFNATCFLQLITNPFLSTLMLAFQYLGILVSTSFCHCIMPPSKLYSRSGATPLSINV